MPHISDTTNNAVVIIIFLVIVAVFIFIVLREYVLWYFKINLAVKQNERIIELLEELVEQMADEPIEEEEPAATSRQKTGPTP